MLSSQKPEKAGTSKEMLREIFQAALLAVDAYKAVNRHREEIRRAYDLNKCARLLLIGFGKAASPMSKAVADSLPDRLAGELSSPNMATPWRATVVTGSPSLKPGIPCPMRMGCRRPRRW